MLVWRTLKILHLWHSWIFPRTTTWQITAWNRFLVIKRINIAFYIIHQICLWRRDEFYACVNKSLKLFISVVPWTIFCFKKYFIEILFHELTQRRNWQIFLFILMVSLNNMYANIINMQMCIVQVVLTPML